MYHAAAAALRRVRLNWAVPARYAAGSVSVRAPMPHASGDSTTARGLRPAAMHALAVVAGFSVVFGWLFARAPLTGTYLSESDLYEYYLPIFLAPITTWSAFEFGGLPAFADPGDFTVYPPHVLFARLIGSWTGLAVSAFVLASSFTYAYVYGVTRSRAAAAYAGLAYGLSEALVERLPHAGTLHAAAWLPLIVLSIERLQGARPRRWLAIGAVGAACAFLAGHPQPAIYIYYCCGVYALVFGRVSAAPRVYYARVAGLFALGGLLTAVKSLPFVEASFHMARQDVSFSQFTSHANSPAQMLSMVLPTILHEGREAPTYVGVLTLMLAGVCLARWWRGPSHDGWRVAVWAGLSLFALLMGAGDSTPIPWLAFHLPLYGNFRAGARHLILAAFGLSVLAGLGVSALQRRDVSLRAVAGAVAAVACATLAGALLVLRYPAAFAFENRHVLPWTPPLWNTGIWVQFGLLTAAGLVTMIGCTRAAARGWVLMALALLGADALYGVPYAVGATGLVPITMPASAAGPSVHARRLAAGAAPLHQRLLAPGGTHRDAVVPAVWARVWQIPIAGGYGPMLMARQHDLSEMGTNGSVPPSVLGPDDAALDVLAVKTLVMKDEDLVAPDTFTREGVVWAQPLLDLEVGRPECGVAYPRQLSLPLPVGGTVSEVAIVGHLRCAESLATGIVAASVDFEDDSGVAYTQDLRVGVDVAEKGLSDPAIAQRAGHAAARVFDDPDARPFEYLMRVTPPSPVRARRMTVRVPAIGGWLSLSRITAIDGQGRATPLSVPSLYLADANRWTKTGAFRTSRTSDRDADDDAPGETGYVVFENRRARPRAWIVPDVEPATAAVAQEAFRHAQLADGRRFDPAVMALVDADAAPDARHFAPGAATVAVASVRDAHIAVDVTSGGGFLVLSEAFYPGWRARIGDRPLTIERTDLHLQGVVVPPGAHRVDFEFASTSLAIGRAVSVLALLVVAWLVWRPARRPEAA